MLIQKTFHLGMRSEAARAKLCDLREYRHDLSGVERAAVAEDEGCMHIEFRLPYGFHGNVDLARELGENPAQILFRSRDGNLEVLGVLEFFEIKPELTEIVLTVDYTIDSPFFRLLDYLAHSMERFINEQIERVEAHFARPVAGIRADRNLPTPINGHTPFTG